MIDKVPVRLRSVSVKRVIIDDDIALDSLIKSTGGIFGDGFIDVVDVVTIVTWILAADGSADACNADVNSDGVLNVIDVVLLVNIILDSSYII